MAERGKAAAEHLLPAARTFENGILMRMKIVILLIIVLTLSTGVAFYFTPHVVVYTMRKAAERGDANKLSAYIDYPALRESLKATCNDMIAHKTDTGDDEGLVKVFGRVFAPALVSPMIDALVKPEGLAMLMKGKKPHSRNSQRRKAESSQEEDATELSMSYESFNRFVVAIRQKGSFDDPIELMYIRHGIASWKLSAVRLTQ